MILKMPGGNKVKIPFLNGGLFDKKNMTGISLLSIQSCSIILILKVSCSLKKIVTTAGAFLDFLNAFNFTVHEDSPGDHTVAVDPEMLGHIFENLLEDNKEQRSILHPESNCALHVPG